MAKPLPAPRPAARVRRLWQQRGAARLKHLLFRRVRRRDAPKPLRRRAARRRAALRRVARLHLPHDLPQRPSARGDLRIWRHLVGRSLNKERRAERQQELQAGSGNHQQKEGTHGREDDVHHRRACPPRPSLPQRAACASCAKSHQHTRATMHPRCTHLHDRAHACPPVV